MTDAAKGEVLFYQRDDRAFSVEVRLVDDTQWLSQQQIVDLFQTSREHARIHLENFFEEGQFQQPATFKDFLEIRQESRRQVWRSVVHYKPRCRHLGQRQGGELQLEGKK